MEEVIVSSIASGSRRHKLAVDPFELCGRSSFIAIVYDEGMKEEEELNPLHNWEREEKEGESVRQYNQSH